MMRKGGFPGLLLTLALGTTTAAAQGAEPPVEPAPEVAAEPALPVEPAPAMAPPAEPVPMAGGAPASADPARGPGFVNLNRYDGVSRAGLELTYFALENGSDDTLLQIDAYAQYIDPARGFGGYAKLPITYLSDIDNGEAYVGNLELGGIYVPRLGRPGLGVVLHAGVVLPTGAQDLDVLATVFGASSRAHELPLGSARSTWLRLGVAPMYREGNVFARADLGLDANLATTDGDTVDPLVYLNVGVGVIAGPVAITGELNNEATTNGDVEDQMINTAALGVRGTGRVQPYGALVIPLEDELSDVWNVALRVGVASTF